MNNDNMNNVKAIVFDFDGVLVDSVFAGFEAYKEIARQLKLPAYETVTDFKRDHARPYKEVFTDWGVTEKQADIAAHIFYDTIVRLEKEIGFIPSMEHVIQRLSKQFRLAIVSGNKRSIIEQKLKHSQIFDCFETIIGCEDVSEIKPNAEGLYLCMKRLGLQKNEIYFIGDTIIDVMQGKNAGVHTIIMHGYGWNLKEQLVEKNPDILIEKPEELLTLLNGVKK